MKTRSFSIGRTRLILLALVVSLAILAAPAGAEEENAQELVDRAEVTFNSLMNDPNMTWLRMNLRDAKAIFIVPSLIKGGFIWGGTGGSGVLLARDENTGIWSNPGFYRLGSVTFGPQIGGAVSEVLMLIRTQKAMDRLLSTSFKLGGDTTIAAGPVGAGARANVRADIVSFARSRGAFAGVSLEGSMIQTRDNLNEAYYGRPVRPADIFVKGDVSNPGADDLRKSITAAALVKSRQP